jgi:hypothetical protein
MEIQMKTLILTMVALFSALPAIAADGQGAEASPEGLACFENLTPPEFPMAALQAHVDGSVWVNVEVSPSGAAGKIDTQVVSAWADGAKLLTPAVEKAIHAAKFKAACHGKTVSTVFRYQLYGEPVAAPKVTSNSDGPRMMVIQSQPALAPNAAAKQTK